MSHPHRPGRPSDDGRVRLFGIHAVEAALRNPARALASLQLTDNAERRLAEAISERKAKVRRVTPRDLDRVLGPDSVHQGALLETELLPEPILNELASAAADRPLIVLDQVTDPHNVGAILRSAAAFGAAGLVMTRRHSPPLGGALAKVASGALEIVPIALAQNLARALAELKEAGRMLIGLDGDAAGLIEDQPLTGSVAFVLGAEGKGLRRLTAELCDQLCRIDTERTGITSLNVSNAAAVVMHLAAIRRRTAA
jgi:23S rRNA (guanosine2251-2'-O)-methyltransferase